MKKIIGSMLLVSLSFACIAQEDLSQLFSSDEEQQTGKTPVYATFKSPRIVNGRSNETVKKHELDFIVSHKFGDAAGKYGGVKTFFGTDAASDIRLAFDYGITDRLTAGIARYKGATAIRELYEGSLKLKMLQQRMDNHVPIGITLFGNAVVSTMTSNVNEKVPDHFDNMGDRWSFFAQAIIVRKFSSAFSLALTPSYVHYNRVGYGDENDTYALGIGARIKLSRRMSLIGDYFYIFRKSSVTSYFKDNGLPFYNPLGIGFEVETGGHVFQLTFTNSTALLENQFIPYTTTSWTKGQFRWGFHMSRTFALKKSRNNADTIPKKKTKRKKNFIAPISY